MRTTSLITAIIMALVCLGARSQGHPVHQSTAEAEYNPTTKKLEVSLTVDLNDLEFALTRQCEHTISLEKTPDDEFDAQMQIYLARNFAVTDAADKVAKIELVGRELVAATIKSADPSITVHFEMLLTEGLVGAKLRHSLFCGLFKDHTNLVHLRHGKKKVELRFTKDDAAKNLGAAESIR